jgi:hypothetical protein
MEGARHLLSLKAAATKTTVEITSPSAEITSPSSTVRDATFLW